MTTLIEDPVEREIALGLTEAGILFVTHPRDTQGLDFYLPHSDLYIECKQYHSERIAGQMARVTNVIAIQGLGAAKLFRRMITAKI